MAKSRPMIVVTPASAKALMVALDKKTGKELWATAPVAETEPTYSSAIAVNHDGVQQIVNCCSTCVFGVDAKNGKLLWSCPHELKGSQVVNSPSYVAGRVFVPSTWIKEAKSYCVKMGEGTGTVDWIIATGNPTGSAVATAEQIVATSTHKPAGWSCYDPATGKSVANKPDIGWGAAVLADGRYYCLTHKGQMLLMQISEDGFKVASQFEYQSKKGDVWAHPVICDGKLYLRYHDQLNCYDIGGK